MVVSVGEHTYLMRQNAENNPQIISKPTFKEPTFKVSWNAVKTLCSLMDEFLLFFFFFLTSCCLDKDAEDCISFQKSLKTELYYSYL